MNAPTNHNTSNADEAQFLAPEASPRAAFKRPTIRELRSAVDSLNWSRNDLGGATRAEWLNLDVRTRLQIHIEIVEGLLPSVFPRFVDDIRRANEAIDCARAHVARWQAARAEISAQQHADERAPTVRLAPAFDRSGDVSL